MSSTKIFTRFHKFLLWLGIPLHQISDTKPNEFCRIVSEFALEYRTTRERVLQQLEKKANHRERNKTRGKMITEVSNFLFPTNFITQFHMCAFPISPTDWKIPYKRRQSRRRTETAAGQRHFGRGKSAGHSALEEAEEGQQQIHIRSGQREPDR